MGQWHTVFLVKYGDTLLVVRVETFLIKIYRISSTQESNGQIMPRRRVVGKRRYKKAFPRNMKAVNLNISPNYGGIET